MATEQSPPQIRIILTVAFSSVVILVALNYVFKSYFIMMTEEVEHDHLSAPAELLKLREGEKRNLTSSPVPIAQAMQEIAHGRTGDVTPQQSTDLGPMVGWIRTPNQAVVDRMNEEAATAAAAAAAADAGAGAADAASSDASSGGAKRDAH